MTKTVLIIDDEDDIREIATLSLEVGAGWSVLTASSGAAGVARAIEASPDAILLDVMMPELDGPGTFALLRAEAATHEIPVIFLTAKVRAADRDQLANLGAAGVLSKPFDPMGLSSQIADVLGWAG